MALKDKRATGASTDPVPTTRQRILHEASQLIAQQGYHATTTRQIAERVGVQQPSLFYHFGSKAEIVTELLQWDLDQTLAFLRKLSRRSISAGERLYIYLRYDLEHLIGAPYNLAGVFTEDVMRDPAFALWAGRRAEVHRRVAGIVDDGVRLDEFIDVSPELITEAIAGILIGALTAHSGGRTAHPELSDQIASLVVRGLLRDQDRLPAIRAAAHDDPVTRI